MSKGIAVVGNVFVDIKGFPYETYIPAGRNSGEVKTVHGGVGRNIAEDLANMGVSTAFVSTVDNSAEAKDVVSRLVLSNVNTDYINHVRNGMGIWLAIFNENGDVVGSISKRPDQSALHRFINSRGDEIFSDCDSVIIEIDLDEDIVKSVFSFAEKYMKRVYACVANITIAAERLEYIKKSECLICNVQEAGLLFSENYDNLSPKAMCTELAAKLPKLGIKSMIVTMGEKGAVYADLSGRKEICPAADVRVVDTTGAGDAFCAGAMAGLSRGDSPREAMKLGTRIAASVIASPENVCTPGIIK